MRFIFSRMATVAARRRALPRVPALDSARLRVLLGLLGLLALSFWLRTAALGEPYWIDEGLSLGISSHALVDIPGVLRQDGSPPLYYMLLHVWVDLFGSGEVATQSLSLVFSLATIPVGLWAGWSLFGERAGWLCAAACALNPFLTTFTHDARMYTLVMLLSIVIAACFAHAFVYRRRGHLIPFAIAIALLLYTHNWGLFVGAGAVVALVVCWRAADDRRGLIRDALLAFGGVALAFAPWLPTLAYQATHTGAPWSQAPPIDQLWLSFTVVLAGQGPTAVLALGAGVGVAALVGRAGDRERTAVLALIALGVATLVLAWGASQLSPAWAGRYLAALFGPLVLVAALGLARAGRIGLAAGALVVLLWGFSPGVPDFTAPSLEKTVVDELEPQLERGDLVISTHPERLPVLDHYLPEGMRYATTLGTVDDPGVMDWRDALARLRGAGVQETLGPLLDRVPRGGRVLLVRPIVEGDARSWQAPWTRLVRRRSSKWFRALNRDPRFERVDVTPLRAAESGRGVRGILYIKRGGRSNPAPGG